MLNKIIQFDNANMTQVEERESFNWSGPFVQSIISLTSSLRGELVKCFNILQPNTEIFCLDFLKKTRPVTGTE